jgi:hypothetical protein
MAINQAYPSLADIEPSWADIDVTATITGGALLEMADIKSIKWSRKVEVGEKRGASGGRVMSRTTGSLSQDASAVFYRSGTTALLTNLMNQAVILGYTRGNQVIVSLVAFDIMIQFTPPGTSDIWETKLKGCRYLGDVGDMKEGADADTWECTLNPLEVVELINGVEIALL